MFNFLKSSAVLTEVMSYEPQDAFEKARPCMQTLSHLCWVDPEQSSLTEAQLLRAILVLGILQAI